MKVFILEDDPVESSHENTGYQFAKRIAREIVPETTCIVHSYNPAGSVAIVNALYEAGVRAVRVPFGPTVLSYLEKL